MNVDAVLIAGPTASGKSAAALALAEQVGGVIVNADSMQVYAELRALTARPSQADEARLPHRLYGHVHVRERYSAGRYQDESARALAEARGKKLLPIFVGGTGLYFAVLTEGLSPIPPVPAEVRAAVRQRFETLGREAFFADFAARDPATAAKLKASDTQRLLRAADVFEATGCSLSAWQTESGKPVLEKLRLARFVVSPPREILSERIDRRFEDMMHKGALAEASALRGLDDSLPAAKALGLPPLWRHLAGETSLEAAISEAQIATRQYAKRQQTWFRNRMNDWKWLESERISNLITSMVQELS
jgi:tRNA dimethylallyltransferase